MWGCPACGREFANPNQWHSCGNLELEDLLARHTDHAVDLYRAVESALFEIGSFRVHPQKTRIAFISRMTFAGVTLARRWIDLSFITPFPIDDRSIRRIELYGPTSFGHHLRLSRIEDLDVDVRRWLADALRRGNQESLDPQAWVEPVVGRPLEILVIPLRARVVRGRDDLALLIPRYAADALDANPDVNVRIGKAHLRARLTAGRLLLFDPQALAGLGLGDGDRTDAFLTADL